MLDLATLLDDGGVRAQPEAGFDGAMAERLGRALGTLARRRAMPHLAFIVGRADRAPHELKLGLVRGILQAGHDVLDAGVVDEASWGEAATARERPTGIYIGQLGDVGRLQLLLDGPLDDDKRADLASIFAAGDFFAGAGRYDPLT